MESTGTSDQEQAVGRYCQPCAAWRTELVCPLCGADLEDAPRAKLEADGQGTVGAATGSFLAIVLGEAVRAAPATLLALLLVWGALASRTIADRFFGRVDEPGQLLALYVMTFWLLDRTRATATSGHDLDPLELGGTLLRSIALYPLLAGLSMGQSWTTWIPALVITPILPLMLGPLATRWRELHPASLFEAYQATHNYPRLIFWTAVSLYPGLLAIGYAAGDPWWRAPIAVAGVSVAGTMAGLARRGAEHQEE